MLFEVAEQSMGPQWKAWTQDRIRQDRAVENFEHVRVADSVDLLLRLSRKHRGA